MDLIEAEEVEIKNAKIEIPKAENAISSHKPLANYEQTEDYSIDRAKDLYINGIKAQGSRNNSMFLVGLYLKYQGLTEEECKNELYEWMDRQNPDMYSTPLQQCYKEIEATVKNMYEKNYNLAASKKDLTVTYDEMRWIIEKCPEKNQKLIIYAMLVHSKRYANAQGVFYFPYKDIEAATGLYDQAIRHQINKLTDLGIIEIIERNRKPKGKGLEKKPPNLYRLNIESDISNEYTDSNKVFKTQEMNNMSRCLKFYFSEKELKKLLPRRQYEILVG
ncbi:hypothetical protein PACILC2_53870 [Paenibacillus cisolokensis]|uniref:Primase C-terminal 1 domain-containing protein n=1 Tax=Paenibacillus cisolokensis TaxID=1658519 RepID=A0ABQ4NF49_9BACL|nr:primase C-terminal domain-containing protein [Paenibacillus cisolokensis]GIQ66819.1 hypothetical protein PACILC2_53870 [Paenibacillus cisolokensis]